MNENRLLSPFYVELLSFLQSDVANRCAEEGFDPGRDPELKFLMEELSSLLKGEALPLSEIVDSYQHVFGSRGPIHIEKILVDAFPMKDFREKGLERYFPHLYRGLPRLYHRDNPAHSRIKKNFTHLPTLKKQAVSRALFSLYANYVPKGRLTVFSWAMNDGFGDYIAAADVARILRARFPMLEVALLVLAPVHLASHMQGDLVIPYTGEAPPLSPQALALLQSSDLVLQIPTHYPYTAELAMLPMERIGEYGFVESNWFHPRSRGYAMGLHFLEKGILIRKLKRPTWSEVRNERLLAWHKRENHFYLAYLSSAIGGAIYLHALLKSLIHDPKDIDICTPDLEWFIRYVEKQNQARRPILEWEMGVQSIEVHFEEKVHFISLASQGKKVRLLSPGAILQTDFHHLLQLSGDFVAVRGNQSFTEAISAGKPFFYDGREHGRNLVKDLAALAENRLREHPSTLECIRGIQDALLYHLPLQEEEWVDETFFQERKEWTTIALKIGLALQDPEVNSGFKKLSQIVAAEFSANQFICHLVQRAFCHLKDPGLKKEEAEGLTLFSTREQTFSQLVQKVVKKMGDRENESL